MSARRTDRLKPASVLSHLGVMVAVAAVMGVLVAGLSPLDRDIFRLCATEGYAYQAAAEELGVEHGVVRNRLSRIRTRLRTVAKEST